VCRLKTEGAEAPAELRVIRRPRGMLQVVRCFLYRILLLILLLLVSAVRDCLELSSSEKERKSARERVRPQSAWPWDYNRSQCIATVGVTRKSSAHDFAQGHAHETNTRERVRARARARFQVYGSIRNFPSRGVYGVARAQAPLQGRWVVLHTPRLALPCCSRRWGFCAGCTGERCDRQRVRIAIQKNSECADFIATEKKSRRLASVMNPRFPNTSTPSPLHVYWSTSLLLVDEATVRSYVLSPFRLLPSSAY
jgi:hypothetical protein